VKVRSVRSKLFSISSIQSVVKKAIVEKLSYCHKIKALPETGPEYPIHVYLKDDAVTIAVDTTGKEGLHKRSYRRKTAEALLRETIAAGLVILSRWRYEEALIDPFCGSGTVCIEVGMMARNIALGLKRHFCSENWRMISKDKWKREKDLAKSSMKSEGYKIIGSDIDEKIIEIAKINAKSTGVDIKLMRSSFDKLKAIKSTDVIITNPLYGVRLKKFRKIHRDPRILRENFPSWKYHIISSFENFERMFWEKSQ